MVGGTIIKDYGWQATFFTIIPMAIALLITIWRVDEQQLGRRPGQESVVTEEISERLINKNYKDNTKYSSNNIDIKGAITLAITTTSFLLVLTYLETGYKLSIIIYTNFSYLKSLTFGQLCVDKNLDT
jgi:hypothetical protein